MKNYRVWLFITFFSYVLMDFVRRFFAGSKVGLILFDGSLAITYLAFMLSDTRSRFGRSGRDKLLLAVMALYALLVVGECMNPSTFARFPLTKFFAVRNYLMGLPCVWIGYELVSPSNREKLYKGVGIYFWVFAAAAVFGVVGFFTRNVATGGVQDILTPMGGAIHSFEAGEQILSSSFFASNVRFAIFILATYLMLWAFAKETGRTLWVSTVLALAGIYVSGSRAMLTLFVGFVAMAFLLFRRRGGPPRKRLVASTLAFAAVAAIVLSFWTDLSSSMTSSKDYDYRVRAQYLVRGKSEYLERSTMAMAPAFLRPKNPDLLFGVGVGTFGQETFAAPYLYESRYYLVAKFFHEKPGMPLADSGLTKICIEMGVVGLSVFLLYFGLVLFFSGICIWRSALAGDALGFAVAFFPIMWMTQFLKGHQMLADLGSQSFVHLSTGLVLATLHRLSQPQRQRQPQLVPAPPAEGVPA